jgi:hypothetical protein
MTPLLKLRWSSVPNSGCRSLEPLTAAPRAPLPRQSRPLTNHELLSEHDFDESHDSPEAICYPGLGTNRSCVIITCIAQNSVTSDPDPGAIAFPYSRSMNGDEREFKQPPELSAYLSAGIGLTCQPAPFFIFCQRKKSSEPTNTTVRVGRLRSFKWSRTKNMHSQLAPEPKGAPSVR